MFEHVKPGSLMIGYIHNGMKHDVFDQSLHQFRDLDALNLKLLNSYSSARGPFHEDNRNKVVDLALTKPRIEWLLFIDTDIEWEPEVPYKLLHMANDTDKRIIAGLYFGKPGWSKFWLPQWYDLNEKNEFIIAPKLYGNPLQKIAGCGGGIMLIHMSVFKEFPEVDHGQRWFGRDPWTVDGKIERIGEDLTFNLRLNRLCYPGYERWTNLPLNKIQIWGHRGVVVKHHKETAIGLDEYLAQGTASGMRNELDQEDSSSRVRTVDELSDSRHESGMQSPRIIQP